MADKNPIGPWTIYVCPGCDQPSAFPDEHSHPGHPGGMVKFERIEVGPVNQPSRAVSRRYHVAEIEFRNSIRLDIIDTEVRSSRHNVGSVYLPCKGQ